MARLNIVFGGVWGAMAVVSVGWVGAGEPSAAALPAPFDRLGPLHARPGRPAPGDWLAEHPEPGQTYRQYVRSDPVRPDQKRRVLYIQPLGEFTATQRKLIGLSGEYLGHFFGLPVRIRDDLALSLVPADARRIHPSWKVRQVLTGYVLEKILAPRLPDDALACLAFTTTDLWPGEGWNFVFGQASLSDRVGVWSIYRFGDPEQGPDAFRLTLRRTLALATHETGHMLSMAHCTLFECNMAGSNSLAEADRRPMWLCPHCLAKLCFATGMDPREHYRRLAAFCENHGFVREKAFYQKSLRVLEGGL